MTSKDDHEQGHEIQTADAGTSTADLGRRRILLMLGLALPAAYVAPTILSLSEAEAADRRSRSRSRRSRNRRRNRRRLSARIASRAVSRAVARTRTTIRTTTRAKDGGSEAHELENEPVAKPGRAAVLLPAAAGAQTALTTGEVDMRAGPMSRIRA
jgi:hypothetical protein